MPQAQQRSDPPEPGSIPLATEIRIELDKILASQTFSSAKSLIQFLQYVVEKELEGEGRQIKEYVLGVEVFGRGEHFDARTDPIVRVQAVKLRARLKRYYEVEGQSDPILVTLPKGSYLPAFERRVTAAVASAERAAPVVLLSPKPPLPWRRAVGAAVVVVILAVAGLVFFQRHHQPAPITSLAVLPFVNMTGVPQNEYLSDGLTEELLDRLAQVQQLRVPARTSSFQFKNKTGDIAEIGKRLKVDAVLEGSIRTAGRRIRVTAQLNRVSDGYHMWSHSFERDVQDILQLEEELASTIVQELQQVRDTPPPPRQNEHLAKAEAYDDYLRARYFFGMRTEEGFRTAIRYFEQAVDVDPEYGRAWAGMANSYGLLAQNGQAAPRDVIPKARSAAEKALALNDSLADAHAAMGLVLNAQYDSDPAGALRELQRALALNPNYASGHQWYSRILGNNGRLEESLREIQIAMDLDPLSPILFHAHGVTLQQMGRREAARAAFRRAIALDPSFMPSHEYLAASYLEQGSCPEAIAFQQKAAVLSGGELGRRAILGEILAKCGDKPQAARLLNEVQRAAAERYVSPSYMARLAIAVGRNQVACEWLERAFDERHPWVKDLPKNSAFPTLRAEPRFQMLLERIALSAGYRLTPAS